MEASLRLGSGWSPWRESDDNGEGSGVPTNGGDEIRVFVMEGEFFFFFFNENCAQLLMNGGDEEALVGEDARKDFLNYP